MSDFVLDASLALQWFLEDEENRDFDTLIWPTSDHLIWPTPL